MADDLLMEYLSNSGKPLLLVEAQDEKTIIKWANKSFGEMLGVLPFEIVNETTEKVFKGSIFFDELRSCNGTALITSALGKNQIVEVKTFPLKHSNWAIEVFAIEEEELHIKQKEAEEKLVALADLAPIGIFHSEIGLRLEYLNSHFVSIFGQSASTLLGVGWLDFVKKSDQERIIDALAQVISGEVEKVSIPASIDRGKDVRDVVFHCKHIVKKNKISGFIGVLEDVTERLSHEKQLHYLITHDSLTGALNRQALTNKLNELWADHKRKAIDDVSLFFVDIDNFKYINDTYGHAAGDHILTEIVARLSSKTDANSKIYRYAGDEFIFISNSCGGEDEFSACASNRMASLLQCFDEKFEIGGGVSISVTGSIGHAMLSQANSIAELIHIADSDMYEIKKDKKIAEYSSATF